MAVLFHIAVVCVAQWVAAYTVKDFQGQVFKFKNEPSGIYEVDVGLGDFEGFLAGYGDFNNDKSVDIVTIDSSSQNIYINYWTDGKH